MASSRTPPPDSSGDNSAGHDDFADSDALFVARLAGRSQGPATLAAQREADALRAALEADADPEWQARIGPEAVERQWQSLERKLAAVRDERESAARATPSFGSGIWQRWRNLLSGGRGSTTPPWPTRWAAASALAGIAALAIALSPALDAWRDAGGAQLPPAQVRMGGDGVDARVQIRATRTPRRDAEAFAAALRASPAAAQPGLYSDPDGAANVVIVEVELEGAQLGSAGAVFEAQGLRRPARVGLARVEFGR